MNRRAWIMATFLGVAVFVIVAAHNAWLGDDAYITFRTVDNLLQGHGPRWNTAERVQAYTHPLWMALIAAQTLVSGNIYLTAIVTSLLLAGVAALVLSLVISRSWWMSLAVLAAMTASKAFVDYSTSGLENPLTHLLVAMFYAVYFRFGRSPRAILCAYALAGLAFLNRMDSILVFLPVLFRLAASSRAARSPRIILPAVLPVAAWESFSLYYYGSWVPNTAYAKLNTGIPGTELAWQSLHYFSNSWALDKVTLPVIVVAMTVHFGVRRKLTNPLVEAIILYLLYVVKIGGDFMSGRFLALPFLLACVYLSRHGLGHALMNRAAFVIALVAGLCSPMSPMYNNASYGLDRRVAGPAPYSLIDPWGISDERALYYRATGLLARDRLGDYPEHYWYYSGLSDKLKGVRVSHQGLTGVGYYGYAAGANVFVIDRYALTDPLLSRLPARRVDPDLAGVPELGGLKWRIGHFTRDIPPGYVETILEGTNRIKDRGVAEFYDKVALVTRGPLNSPGRLRAIIGLNTGAYDRLLDGYRRKVETRANSAAAARE